METIQYPLHRKADERVGRSAVHEVGMHHNKPALFADSQIMDSLVTLEIAMCSAVFKDDERSAAVDVLYHNWCAAM